MAFTATGKAPLGVPRFPVRAVEWPPHATSSSRAMTARTVELVVDFQFFLCDPKTRIPMKLMPLSGNHMAENELECASVVEGPVVLMVMTTSTSVPPAGMAVGAKPQLDMAGNPEQAKVVADEVSGLGAKLMCAVPDCPAWTVIVDWIGVTVKSGFDTVNDCATLVARL